MKNEKIITKIVQDDMPKKRKKKLVTPQILHVHHTHTDR